MNSWRIVDRLAQPKVFLRKSFFSIDEERRNSFHRKRRTSSRQRERHRASPLSHECDVGFSPCTDRCIDARALPSAVSNLRASNAASFITTFLPQRIFQPWEREDGCFSMVVQSFHGIARACSLALVDGLPFSLLSHAKTANRSFRMGDSFV